MLRRALRFLVTRQTRLASNGNAVFMQCAVEKNIEVIPTLKGASARCKTTLKTQKCLLQPDEDEYEKCITTLNTLQSNADTIRRSILLNNKQLPLDDMYKYLQRSGLSIEELERLSFIHVSGTKGKGSTCALTESILRAHDVKTGFFSSPHLLSVTERIRINGESISKKKFVDAFRRVYKRLKAQKEHDDDMPAYFKFLTIMSFHIFMEEKVDVIILEVGIGGEFDCTNIIRNTQTVGITSLGLEHTALLGNTLKEIAWQKAGIIKAKSDVYTSVTQPECLKVIKERAIEKNATIHIVPDYSQYYQDAQTKQLLSSLNDVIRLNGSLAIQLALDWLRKNGFKEYEKIAPTKLTSEVQAGLINCSWPGRCQTLKKKNINFYLDGAHTVESISVCSDWFKHVTAESTAPKVLIFNTTGDRDSKRLLEILHGRHQFALAFFVPNIASGTSNHKDNMSVFGINDQIKRARMHSSLWHQLCLESDEEDSSHVCSSILESLRCVRDIYGEKTEVDVLFTGSLHLIGATMAALKEIDCKGLGATKSPQCIS